MRRPASGVNYGTFYPVKDNYRDTLKISGNRQEPIAVTIRIYNANNKRVALVTKSEATGAYSYSWNGRDGKKLLPAGKYRIVQTLVDEAGTTRAVTKLRQPVAQEARHADQDDLEERGGGWRPLPATSRRSGPPFA